MTSPNALGDPPTDLPEPTGVYSRTFTRPVYLSARHAQEVRSGAVHTTCDRAFLSGLRLAGTPVVSEPGEKLVVTLPVVKAAGLDETTNRLQGPLRASWLLEL